MKKILKPVIIKSVLVYLCKIPGLRRRVEEFGGGPFVHCSLGGGSLEFGFCVVTERLVAGSEQGNVCECLGDYLAVSNTVLSLPGLFVCPIGAV